MPESIFDLPDPKRDPHCPQCEYNLQGITHETCPECGWTIVREDIHWYGEDEGPSIALLRPAGSFSWLPALMQAAMLAWFMPWRLGRGIPRIVPAGRALRVSLIWKGLFTACGVLLILFGNPNPLNLLQGSFGCLLFVTAFQTCEFILTVFLTGLGKAPLEKISELSAHADPSKKSRHASVIAYLLSCYCPVSFVLAILSAVLNSKRLLAALVIWAVWWVFAVGLAQFGFSKQATEFVSGCFLAVVAVAFGAVAVLVIGVFVALIGITIPAV